MQLVSRLDLSLPRLNGMEVLPRALKLRPSLQVLILSMHPEAQYAPRLLAAVDRTHSILRLSGLSTVVTVASFAVGLHWGIVGVAACYAIVTTPVQLLYLRKAAHVLHARLRDLLAALAVPFVVGGTMTIVCLLTRKALVDAHVDTTGRATEAHVVKASGSKEADAKAIAAVMQWHFKPAMVQGKPTDAHVRIPVIIESNVTGAASDDASHLGKS